MAEQNPNDPLKFGRVIYFDPNNNIEGTGRGTNFTFKPEDYSIFVDLQVDVVDRNAYNGTGSDDKGVSWTVEWDAKGTHASLFKGTNGFLTTRAMDTSFIDVATQYNKEAIGINSIEIRYNSWNYPEITIQFTDIRGASLMSAADYAHTPLATGDKSDKQKADYSSSFFSTFFMFPYPRYTLIVKGFYGRPVSYTLCVSDFKTRFNSSTGNFDITVLFIGYMYGLLTDVPMRLLFAAPYDNYAGAEYWDKQKANGTFVYKDGTNTPMFTFIEVSERVKAINSFIDESKELKDAQDTIAQNDSRISELNEIQGLYENFIKSFDYESKMRSTCMTNDNGDPVYIILLSANGTEETTTETVYVDSYSNSVTGGGFVRPEKKEKTKDRPTYKSVVDNDSPYRTKLREKISEYNGKSENLFKVTPIPFFCDIESASQPELYGANLFEKESEDNEYPVFQESFAQKTETRDFFTQTRGVKPEHYDTFIGCVKELGETIKTHGYLKTAKKIAVSVIKVDDFLASVRKALSVSESSTKSINDNIKETKDRIFNNLVGFNPTIKNLIDMCLAHLDTIMECIYSCMNHIRGLNGGAGRMFSEGNLNVEETDVLATIDGKNSSQPLFLPPFFAFRKKKNDIYEDAWIGDEPRLSDTNVFKEIDLINGILKGVVEGIKNASEQAQRAIEIKVMSDYPELPDKDMQTMFVSDAVNGFNPYMECTNPDKEAESIMSMFAMRCMLAAIYSVDYENTGNRGEVKDLNKDKGKMGYFNKFASNDVNNVVHTPWFNDGFRKNSTSSGIFNSLTEEDFLNYVTGKGISIAPEGSQLYKVGNMNSPLFTSGGDGNLILSYGNTDGPIGVIPSNYRSTTQAVEVGNEMFTYKDRGSNNGFGGVSRSILPLIEIKDESESQISDISARIGGSSKPENATLQSLGVYERNPENWADYFGVIEQFSWNLQVYTRFWFPNVVEKEDIVAVQSLGSDNTFQNDDGNLYYGETDKKGNSKIARIPMSIQSSSSYLFFIGKKDKEGEVNDDNGKGNRNRIKQQVGWTTTGSKKDIKEHIVPKIINKGGDFTVFGLGCGEGTLFESEFYAIQKENANKTITYEGQTFSGDVLVNLRRAFLFLHSLSTSQFYALANTAFTILKRTYTPCITDIPLSTALFMGGLYFRKRVSENDSNTGNTDNFIEYYGKYKVAPTTELITRSTISEERTGVAALGDKYTQLRPLSPLLASYTKFHYQKISSEDIEKTVKEWEKNNFNELECKNDEKIIYQLCGFWDTPEAFQNMLIDEFISWANGDFIRLHEMLAIKIKDGGTTREITPTDIEAFRKIISEQIFSQKDGNATTGKTYGKFEITKGMSYNDFLNTYFNENLPKYHIRLGASGPENSLLTMLRPESEPVKMINKLLSDGCVIKIPFPRVLMTREMFYGEGQKDERENIKINPEWIKSAWKEFKDGIMKAIEGKAEDDKDADRALHDAINVNASSNEKLSLYISLKNLHDKWLIANKREKYLFNNPESTTGNRKAISNNFFYINSFYEDIGNSVFINAEVLPQQIESYMKDFNQAHSLYSFMYDVAQQARVQMLALPIFNNMADKEYVREMFSPLPYTKLNTDEINGGMTESQYVFLYPEEPSKHLDLSNSSDDADQRYKFADDSFTLVQESGAENPDAPATFFEENPEKKPVPVIGVTFAKQNQSFFKNINVSMDNPKTTEVSILNTFHIADKYNGGNTQVTALGQDLFPIYSNYSYECSVEMMGCACIMPLMYFQLNNIPMFKGTYIIFNVSHSISPGNMTTKFTGQRLSRYRKKKNDDPNNGRSGNGALDSNGRRLDAWGNDMNDCYTISGHKLEHYSTYAEMSKETGIADRAILRAVEFAESHYTGGFCTDGKPQVYYDPWMGNKAGITGEGLTVATQFDNNYVIPSGFTENAEKIEQVKTQKSSGDIASSCTICGAFGVPARVWSKCGVKDLSEFFTRNSSSFDGQAKCFSKLICNDAELKEALTAKDWAKFAKRYKGMGQLTDTGVYCKGDDSNFSGYAKSLEIGYNEADTAGPEYYEKFIQNQPVPPCQEYVTDSSKPMVDIDAVISTILTMSENFYKAENGFHLDYGGYTNKKGEVIIQPGVTTKARSQSVSRCSAYVKMALTKGGLDYQTCHAADCMRKQFITEWCVNFYNSQPQDYGVGGNGINSRCEKGDIVIIEGGKYSNYGHIAIWSGTNWVSDFVQGHCDAYNSAASRDTWNKGGFHFYRFKNRKMS